MVRSLCFSEKGILKEKKRKKNLIEKKKMPTFDPFQLHVIRADITP
jgi:hypothetical protein